MQVGDKVQHKTGGPLMIVHECVGDPWKSKWVAQWWDEAARRFENAEFDELELVNHD